MSTRAHQAALKLLRSADTPDRILSALASTTNRCDQHRFASLADPELAAYHLSMSRELAAEALSALGENPLLSLIALEAPEIADGIAELKSRASR